MTDSRLPQEQETSPANILADLSLFGVAAIWGVNIPVMKIGLEHMDEYAFNAIRLTVSAIVLVVIALRNQPVNVWKLSRKLKWEIFQFAVVTSGIYQVLFLLGVARTTSGNASLIMSTVPMWTALLALVFLKESLGKLAWFGLFVALAGTIIVTSQNGVSNNRAHFIGNIIMLVAALGWSAGTVKGRHVLKYVSPITLSAVASTMMLPLHYAIAWRTLPAGFAAMNQTAAWVPLLYSGIFSTGVALVMWNYGVREAGAAHAAVFQNLIPVIAISSAWLVRGEAITNEQIVGGSLIIGGLVIMRRARSLVLREAARIKAMEPATSSSQ